LFNIQRLRFRCFFFMSVANFSRLAPETQPTPFLRCRQGVLGKNVFCFGYVINLDLPAIVGSLSCVY
ncbi:hypothetical protein ACVGWG_00150, partial [Enterobacter asburiae]